MTSQKSKLSQMTFKVDEADIININLDKSKFQETIIDGKTIFVQRILLEKFSVGKQRVIKLIPTEDFFEIPSENGKWMYCWQCDKTFFEKVKVENYISKMNESNEDNWNIFKPLKCISNNNGKCEFEGVINNGLAEMKTVKVKDKEEKKTSEMKLYSFPAYLMMKVMKTNMNGKDTIERIHLYRKRMKNAVALNYIIELQFRVEKSIFTIQPNDENLEIPKEMKYIGSKAGQAVCFQAKYNGNDVCIKCYKEAKIDELEESLLVEMRHRNVVDILGQYFGKNKMIKDELLHPHIIMPLAIGDYKNLHNRFTLRENVKLLIGCIEGLKYLHKVDVLHLDIKMENVLIFEENNELNAKLCDFGLSKKINGETEIEIPKNWGTTHYLAPEIYLNGKCSKKSDIFSLGRMIQFVLLNMNEMELERECNRISKEIKKKNKSIDYLPKEQRERMKHTIIGSNIISMCCVIDPTKRNIPLNKISECLITMYRLIHE